MISVKRRVPARLAAAAMASGLVAAGAMAAAGPAVADEVPQNQGGGATATLGGLTTSGKAVVHDKGDTWGVDAGLFRMKVKEGGDIQSYCIDIRNPTQAGAQYKETDWEQSSLHNNPDAGKILWILEHSYPHVNDLTKLAKTAGVSSLTEDQAAAGTQVAIWRYSDHVKVDAKNENAEKLADYLTKNAEKVEEPKASLTLTPNAVSGKSGQKLGPITVHTNAKSVTVAPAGDAATKGVKVVDKTGKSITSAVNGSELFFDVPAGTADGATSLTASATTQVPIGRAFTGIGKYAKSQTQILAGSTASNVSAPATANWAKKGAIPAVTAKKDCVKGGVNVTATNQGDEAFTFTLEGKKVTVQPGKSETTFVKVAEDQAYKFTINGPNGFSKTFSGVLDCQTAGSGSTGGGTHTPAPSTAPSSHPSPASAGGSTGSGSTSGSSSTGGGDLAETGSSSATPVIASVAVGLVVVGGGAVFLLRKKKAGAAGQ
ncbi:Cys-Gln thioester bond-forming surface protein [Streptomyces varsoviensis]|uniref:Peptidase n=1 Tax=Streptomyces varsoviensis TaxID=67373 RepID=A0ABR5JB01_9ACTN|nr:Cys-Gln thioester bond-forming surface protein [Streptomyces varsoviensis]KOG90493.1 peptidase [Streptomyces varsoviensis]